jgi:hypothetical protein
MEGNVAEKNGNKLAHPSGPVDMIVAIPTMRRWQRDGTPAPERYLGPLVQALIVSGEQAGGVKIILLNVDPEPAKHTELWELKKYPSVEILTRPRDNVDSVDDIDPNRQYKVIHRTLFFHFPSRQQFYISQPSCVDLLETTGSKEAIRDPTFWFHNQVVPWRN